MAPAVTNELGYSIYIDPTDGRGATLQASTGTLAPHSLELWKRVVEARTWDAAIDVGANYGEMIVGAQFDAATEIVAFEPNKAVLPYLEKTLAGYPRPVELVPLAAADRISDDVKFTRDVSWSGKSTLLLGEREDTEGDEISVDTVGTTTLDEMFRTRQWRSACIKIDVEGAEDGVLRGARGFLGQLEEWVVMVEILHMSTRDVAQLVRDNYVYLLDKRSGGLIRIATSNPLVLDQMLSADWLYGQDALLVSSPWIMP
jgi:FkbM family methyltransferase